MLNLAAPTDPAWAARALAGLDDVLLDHAHCEKKAAGAAVQLLFRYPEQRFRFLQEPLSRLAREELEHFELLLHVLEKRGVAFGRQKPGPYAGRLHSKVRAPEPGHLLDTMLCSALIEARSCERMKLLAEALSEGRGEPELAELYRGLLASEARHHGIYLELAERLQPEDVVRARLADLAAWEAEVIATMPPLARMHG